MKVELTMEQIEQLNKDGYMDIDLGDGSGLYFEFNSDKTFSYAEINNPKGTGRREKYVFDDDDLKKLIPKNPIYSTFHKDLMCPTCFTDMIYHFECCPRCGQQLTWVGVE